MPFPMTPAQAAILGRSRPAPVATVNAPGAGQSAPAPTGQTPVPSATPAAAAMGIPVNNGMDAFLMGRANRGGDITGGTNLLGRLAALGVGSKLRNDNQARQSEAVEAAISSLPPEAQTAARIAVLSGDPSKILPILQQNAGIAANKEEREDNQEFKANQSALSREATAEQNAAVMAQRKAEADSLEKHRSASLAVQERNAEIAAFRAQTAAEEAAQPDYKEANELRDDFRKESEVFRDTADAMRRIEASAEDASPAGDLALIFNYMKVLDPGSTVREGEFATAKGAASVPERLKGVYNQVTSGAALTPAQREDFVNRAGRLFKRSLDSHLSLEEEFSGLGANRGVDDGDFMVDYVKEFRGFEPAASSPTEVNAEMKSINAEIQQLEQELGLGSQ